jgi:hypothetical protein
VVYRGAYSRTNSTASTFDLAFARSAGSGPKVINEGFDHGSELVRDRDGVPLFNQTANLTPGIMKKAVGNRLQILADTRKQYDPNDRLLNVL